MQEPDESSSQLDEIDQQAALWVARCDRELTAGEQDELSHWLAEDPRHGEQFTLHRKQWNRLIQLEHSFSKSRVASHPDLRAPRRERVSGILPVACSLAAAAAIAVALVIIKQPDASGPATVLEVASTLSTQERILEDGSVIELNGATDIKVQYAAGARRVWIEHGEAHFTVERDDLRPFIVTAGGIEVRAVGTAFNVRVDAEVVEVLVTQGRVQVGVPSPDPGARPRLGDAHGAAPTFLPVIEAHQLIVLSLAQTPEPPTIATLTAGEVKRVLSWKNRLLSFTATPLSDVVAEFNRRNDVQMVVIDPELAATRLSVSFRPDNIDGFVDLLQAGFGVRVERRGEFEIILSRDH